MQAIRNHRTLSAGAAVFLAVATFAVLWTQPAHAQRESAGGGQARYTVVHTEGHNLIVTDNANNTTYFYTIDPTAEIGSDLKLRGSIDLNQVGKPSIKTTVVNIPK